MKFGYERLAKIFNDAYDAELGREGRTDPMSPTVKGFEAIEVHVASAYQRDVIGILAPALGYKPFEPGEPGYSPAWVDWNIGDHTAESLAMEAVTKIEALEGPEHESWR